MKKWWDEWGPAVIVFTGIVVLSIIFANWIADKPIGDFIFFVVICIIFFSIWLIWKIISKLFQQKAWYANLEPSLSGSLGRRNDQKEQTKN